MNEVSWFVVESPQPLPCERLDLWSLLTLEGARRWVYRLNIAAHGSDLWSHKPRAIPSRDAFLIRAAGVWYASSFLTMTRIPALDQVAAGVSSQSPVAGARVVGWSVLEDVVLDWTEKFLTVL